MEDLKTLAETTVGSLHALSQRARVSYPALLRLAAGLSSPRLDTLQRLAEAMGLPLERVTAAVSRAA